MYLGMHISYISVKQSAMDVEAYPIVFVSKSTPAMFSCGQAVHSRRRPRPVAYVFLGPGCVGGVGKQHTKHACAHNSIIRTDDGWGVLNQNGRAHLQTFHSSKF